MLTMDVPFEPYPEPCCVTLACSIEPSTDVFSTSHCADRSFVAVEFNPPFVPSPSTADLAPIVLTGIKSDVTN